MDIVFTRHGKSEGNEKEVYHGRLDLPLTSEGKKEAIKAANLIENIHFDEVYISSLERARETAKLFGLSGKSDDRILERNFGIFENLSYDEILKAYPKEAQKWNNDFVNYRIPQGESLKDVYKRTKAFIKDMSLKKGKVLVVTHDGVIRCALSSVFNAPEYFFKFKIDYLKLTQLSIEEGYSYIKAVNSINVY